MSRRIVVLLPDLGLRRELEPLPDGIEIVSEPSPDVEFVVFGPEYWGHVPELVKQLPGLRVLQTTQAGVDSVLPLVPDHITVASASGAHDIAVSEWAVAVILAMRHRLPDFLEHQRRGEWEREVAPNDVAGAPSPIDDLDGATVLVVGYGSIGRALGRRLEPFGARVVGVAGHPGPDAMGPDELARLLPDADVVVVLTPLTPTTEHSVDRAFLARMKRGALLVNAARGRIVDTDALVDELATRRISAALDVTDPEPLPPGHPLWRAPNLLITPHVAGSSTRWLERAYHLAGDQLRRYAAGEPLRNVRSNSA